jgi:hypothetical protein
MREMTEKGSSYTATCLYASESGGRALMLPWRRLEDLCAESIGRVACSGASASSGGEVRKQRARDQAEDARGCRNCESQPSAVPCVLVCTFAFGSQLPAAGDWMRTASNRKRLLSSSARW